MKLWNTLFRTKGSPERIQGLGIALESSAKQRVPGDWECYMTFYPGGEINLSYPRNWTLVKRSDSIGLFPSSAIKISDEPPVGRYSPEFVMVNVGGMGKFSSIEELHKAFIESLEGSRAGFSMRETGIIVLHNKPTIVALFDSQRGGVDIVNMLTFRKVGDDATLLEASGREHDLLANIADSITVLAGLRILP